MNSRNSNIAFSALAIVLPQIIAVLLDKSTGFAFLLGVALIAFYQVYMNNLTPREIASGAAGFVSSSILISLTSKKLIYDRLCQVARTASSKEFNSIVSSESSCLNTAEIFVDLIAANPLNAWYFWIVTLGTSILAVLLYRRYTREK
ncbi:MAG: hypothetical protein ACI977_000023 [Candidatus Nanohaloarchaea archaeon]|jgi:hypothetical protein